MISCHPISGCPAVCFPLNLGAQSWLIPNISKHVEGSIATCLVYGKIIKTSTYAVHGGCEHVQTWSWSDFWVWVNNGSFKSLRKNVRRSVWKWPSWAMCFSNHLQVARLSIVSMTTMMIMKPTSKYIIVWYLYVYMSSWQLTKQYYLACINLTSESCHIGRPSPGVVSGSPWWAEGTVQRPSIPLSQLALSLIGHDTFTNAMSWTENASWMPCNQLYGSLWH